MQVPNSPSQNYENDLPTNESICDAPDPPLQSTENSSDHPSHVRREARQRRVIVSVYLITLSLLYADSFLLAPNLTQVAEEFGFDEDERDVKLGGQIALAFFLVGAPAAFIIGWLADTVHRSPLFSITVFIGEAACFSTYFIKSYNGLLVTRTLTGVSVGGSLPIVYSVLGDLYQAEQRNAIAALASTATGVGVAIGQSLAGFLGPTFGWRLPFLIVSIPAFLCGIILLFTPEPKRGGKERAFLHSQGRCIHHLSINRQSSGVHETAAISPENICKERCNNIDTDECSVNQSEISMNEQRFVREKIAVPSGDHSSVQKIALESFRPPLQQENGEPFKVTHLLQEQELVEHETNQTADEQPLQPTLDDSSSAQQRVVVYEDEKVTLKSTWELCKTPSILLTLLQGVPNVVPFAIASTYLNDYLAQDQGMSVEAATGVLVVFGAGNAVGVILGGVLGHFLYKRSPRFPPLIMGSTIILSCVPMWFMINLVSNTTRIAVIILVGFSLGVLTVASVPIERAIIVNVTLPETRGRANAFLGVIDDLGKGFGPFFLSRLITAFGRRLAFNVSLLGWLIGGTISLFLYCTVKRDEDKVQDTIQARLQERQCT